MNRHQYVDHRDITWPEVQPASKIGSWEGWPDDVRETLQRWNHERRNGGWRLSFAMAAYWPTNRPRVFKCARCRHFHEQPSYGTAIFDGRAYCDGCMIDLARAA